MVNVTAAWQRLRVGGAFMFTFVQACLVMQHDNNKGCCLPG